MQVLVLDCHLHTTTVVRSLAADDFDVVLGVTEQDLAEGFVHVSRFVGSTWTHPDIVDEPGQFGHALLRLLEKKPELKLIFPVGENSVRRMSGLRAQLPDGVVVLMPDNDTIDLCMNKPACYRIAEQNGVPVPVTRVVDTPEALEAIRAK